MLTPNQMFILGRVKAGLDSYENTGNIYFLDEAVQAIEDLYDFDEETESRNTETSLHGRR